MNTVKHIHTEQCDPIIRVKLYQSKERNIAAELIQTINRLVKFLFVIKIMEIDHDFSIPNIKEIFKTQYAFTINKFLLIRIQH
jgi:hypothetical protein